MVVARNKKKLNPKCVRGDILGFSDRIDRCHGMDRVFCIEHIFSLVCYGICIEAKLIEDATNTIAM